MSRAIVLLSGGLDSTTVLAMALAAGHEAMALSVSYGQRHAYELECASRIAAASNVRHVVSTVDLRSVGGSALTTNIAVPKGRDTEQMSADIPVTYVPARNTVMLSLALAWAEVLEANTIFIGVNAVDYSGYPDCRPEYIAAFQNLANLATRRGVEGHQLSIHAPLITLTKAEIITAGVALGVDYSRTSTCYEASELGACGQCDACLLRLQAFTELGLVDPITYRSAV